MNCKNGQKIKKTASVRDLIAVLAICAIGAVTHAAAQVTPPSTPSLIAVPDGNTAYLVGHAFGSQGYTCLPTADGGTAWNPSARPEATLLPIC